MAHHDEDAIFKQDVEQVKQWWKVSCWLCLAEIGYHGHSPPSYDPGKEFLTKCAGLQSPRFEGLIRPYTAEQVVSKRGTLPISYPSAIQGKKLHKLLSEHAKNKTPSHTYGA